MSQQPTNMSQQRRRTPFCRMCFNAGKEEYVYTSHYVRDNTGSICCPTLLVTKCRFCKKPGHTLKYCPTLLQRQSNVEQQSNMQQSNMQQSNKDQEQTPPQFDLETQTFPPLGNTTTAVPSILVSSTYATIAKSSPTTKAVVPVIYTSSNNKRIFERSTTINNRINNNNQRTTYNDFYDDNLSYSSSNDDDYDEYDNDQYYNDESEDEQSIS